MAHQKTGYIGNSPVTAKVPGYYFYQRGNFLPYNDLDANDVLTYNYYDEYGNERTDARAGEEIYGLLDANGNEISADAEYEFGLYGFGTFYQPKDGQVNGSDMVFEFTGDDDLWVYIDGVLVLDLGGCHDALSGRINFTTGKVEYTPYPDNQWTETSIRAQFAAAEAEDSKDWSTDSGRENTFADGTMHTIQIFYMERGAGASDLKISLNLPTIPDGSLMVRKNVENYYQPQMQNLEYTMQLNVNGTAYANANYYIYPYDSMTDKTDENGRFTLKHDQTAVFEGIPGGRAILVTEVAVEPENGQRIDELYKVEYAVTDGNGKLITTEGSENGATKTMPAAGSVSVTINNSAKFTSPLTVTKTFTGTTDNAAPEDFAADFQLYELGTDGTTWAAVGDPVPYSEFTDGSYTFMLEQGKTYAVTETVSNAGKTAEGIQYLNTTVTVTDEGPVTAAKPKEISGAVVLAQEDEGDTILFNNIYGVPTGDLIISKTAKQNTTGGSLSGTFSFYLKDTNLAGKTYDLYVGGVKTGDVTFGSNGETDPFAVTTGSPVTIKGLPANERVEVWETDYEGYAPSWTENSDLTTSVHSGDHTTVTISGETYIYFINTTGAALPSTGGIGTHLYTFLGITTMLGAGMLLLNQRRRKEGPDAV